MRTLINNCFSQNDNDFLNREHYDIISKYVIYSRFLFIEDREIYTY